MRGTFEVREHCDLIMDQYLQYARKGVTAAYTRSQPLLVNTLPKFNEIITSETFLHGGDIMIEFFNTALLI